MDRDRIAEVLVNEARPAMLHYVALDSCIAMTRLAVEVLQHYGYPARGRTVEVIVMNRLMEEMAADGRIRLDARLPDWAVDSGAWGIGVGIKPRPSEVGHVVCFSDDLMLDLSIDQAARPEVDINVIPFAGLWPIEQQKPDAECAFSVGGSYLHYRYRPFRDRFSHSRDWRDFDVRYGRVRDQIIARIG